MKIYIKGLWRFFIIFSVFSIVAIPSLIIYDKINPWEMAENELKRKYPRDEYIAIGYGKNTIIENGQKNEVIQRTYVLIPSVFEEWSIITIFGNNKSDIKIEVTPYGFIYYLVFWSGILGFGLFYSIPMIYKKLIKKVKHDYEK